MSASWRYTSIRSSYVNKCPKRSGRTSSSRDWNPGPSVREAEALLRHQCLKLFILYGQSNVIRLRNLIHFRTVQTNMLEKIKGAVDSILLDRTSMYEYFNSKWSCV